MLRKVEQQQQQRASPLLLAAMFGRMLLLVVVFKPCAAQLLLEAARTRPAACAQPEGRCATTGHVIEAAQALAHQVAASGGRCWAPALGRWLPLRQAAKVEQAM
jgi:hypothetical protein